MKVFAQKQHAACKLPYFYILKNNCTFWDIEPILKAGGPSLNPLKNKDIQENIFIRNCSSLRLHCLLDAQDLAWPQQQKSCDRSHNLPLVLVS